MYRSASVETPEHSMPHHDECSSHLDIAFVRAKVQHLKVLDGIHAAGNKQSLVLGTDATDELQSLVLPAGCCVLLAKPCGWSG